MDQFFRERVAAISRSLAEGLKVYARPSHIKTDEDAFTMLRHLAETVNRYIEADVTDDVIRERVLRAFQMLAVTYQRRDWPTPSVMVEAIKAAKPERSGIGGDWLAEKPLHVVRWLGFYGSPKDFPGGNVVNPDTGLRYEEEARKRYWDGLADLSQAERKEMHRRFDALSQAKAHHDRVMRKLDDWERNRPTREAAE